MNTMETSSPANERGQRGPVEHERREQIIRAADEHFGRYGYNKTTVADLAKAIGVSSAYVYRFFESKQAIGEAVCAMTLARIDGPMMEIATGPQSATDRLRSLYRWLMEEGIRLFFDERKLHEIVVVAVRDRWPPVLRHKQLIVEAVRRVVADGRTSGEFERKTPLDEVARAVAATTEPFAHPVLLEQKEPADLEAGMVAVSNLVLRSLAP